MNPNKRRLHGGPQYPIRCINCGKVDVRPVVIPYEAEKNYDGKLYKLTVPDLRATRCGGCGELYFGSDADAQISAALREMLGLLSPEQVRDSIASLDLSQKQLAERLGVAPETLSRWVTGAVIQSRAMDNLLRVYFGCAQARENLTGANQNREFGARVRHAAMNAPMA